MLKIQASLKIAQGSLGGSPHNLPNFGKEMSLYDGNLQEIRNTIDDSLYVFQTENRYSSPRVRPVFFQRWIKSRTLLKGNKGFSHVKFK